METFAAAASWFAARRSAWSATRSARLMRRPRATTTGATQSIASAASTDSVDALKKSLETQNQNLWVQTDSDGSAVDVHAAKVGNIVIVGGSSTGKIELSSEVWREVTTLPSGWRPKRTEYAAGSSYTGDAIAVRIGTDGIISLMYGGSGSVKYWTFNAVFAL